MATPRCPKCESSSFEIQEVKVKNANYRHHVINCASCGSILAVHEFFNVNARLVRLAEKLRVSLDD